MLYFITSWTILLPVCFIVGLAALHLQNHGISYRKRDQLVLGAWLGLVIASIILMMASLFLPLSLPISTGVLGTLVLLSLRSETTRSQLKHFFKNHWQPWLTGVLLLGIGVACLINRPIVWFDSGLYHFGILRWLNEFGVVPGLALINERFGFTSAWFAFSAPYASPIFGNQVGAVSNGFIYLLALVSIIVFGQSILQRSGQFSDYFGFSFLSLTAIAYGLTIFTGSPILNSYSADVIVTFMVGVIGWIILLRPQQEKLGQPWQEDQIQLDVFFHKKLLVIFFASAALSYKLSAIPLVLIAFSYFTVEKNKVSIIRFCQGFIIFCTTIIPMFIFGIITAGCPFYPTRLMCLDLPWTLSTLQSSKSLLPIAVLRGEKKLPNLLEIQDWIWLITKRLQLLLISSETQFMVLVAILCVITCGVGFVRFKHYLTSQMLWVIALGILGLTFILWTSPLIRFGLGYFTLIPAVVMALIGQRYAQSIIPSLQTIVEIVQQPGSRYTTIIFIGILVVVFLSPRMRPLILFPPPLPTPNLVLEKVTNVNYRYPADFQVNCWNASIPCAPLALKNIALRDPYVGIRGGFKRIVWGD